MCFEYVRYQTVEYFLIPFKNRKWLLEMKRNTYHTSGLFTESGYTYTVGSCLYKGSRVTRVYFRVLL